MNVSISILLFVSIILPSISSGQPCGNSFGGFLDANDKSLIADANGDGKDDLVLFNTGGSGSALRVIDLTTMNDIKSMSYTTLGGGWNETGDRALIAKLKDPNNSNMKRDFLVLFNTGGSGSALRVIDLTTMNDIKSMSYTTLGGGWNEAGDRALIADANGDGNDDLVLFNTGYSLSASALRVIDLKTMNDIKSMSYTTLGGGWNEAGDRALIAKLIDPNDSSLKRDFLVLFNTGYSLSASALRVIDLTTMNDIKSMSYTTLGGGWSEPGDKALIADADKDGNDDLVLFNTGYSLSASALRVINLKTMNDIKSMSYTTLGGGWSEAGDRALIADADGDEQDDLVLFNTDYSLSAIALRVINLTTMNDIKTLSYSAQGGGWNDSNDRALTANVSNDKKVELVLINAGYTGMAIQVKDLTTMANFSTIMHCEGTPAPQPKVTCINPTVLISLSKIYVKIKKDNSFDDEFCFLSASYFNDDCGGSPVYDFVTPLLKKIANSDLKKWLTIDRPIGKLCKNSNIAIVFFDYDDWASNPKTWQFDPICKDFHSVKTLNEFYGTIILKYSDFENLQPGAEKTFSLPGVDLKFKLL